MRLVGGAPWFPSSLVLFSWTWVGFPWGPQLFCAVLGWPPHTWPLLMAGCVCGPSQQLCCWAPWFPSSLVLLSWAWGLGFLGVPLLFLGWPPHTLPPFMAGCVCVCVDHLKRCKTCFAAGGASSLFSLAPTKTLNTAGDITTDHRDVPANFGDIYMVINKCLVLSWFSCWKSCCFQYSWNLNFHDEALRCLSSCQSV